MAVETLNGKRCFLTGAASGIGRATALAAARQGADLYLTDRDTDKIAQVRPGQQVRLRWSRPRRAS